METILKTKSKGIIAILHKAALIIKTITPTQRPHLFAALWFFVCGWLAIRIYAIDPDMSLWNVIGYSVVASLVYALIGACFGASVLQMPPDEMRLFTAGIRGAFCGLFFTLIMVFIVPLYLVLSHSLARPTTQEAEQLLFMYGVVVPFAFVCLPSIVVGIITTVLLRLFHFRLLNKAPQAVAEGE
ncbi:MAG: hypothetical protein Q7V63_06475 [Gammaproteobacteria bacterium]|nr:hypothetical protein [Gammaproteobacteria bacterium]